jgi:hypothetical protein
MVPIFVISSLSCIAHTILFSHSPKNVSPDNVSIKPKPPTDKIMLLSASVIREERPNFRRGIGVRFPAKTLGNALRIISLRLPFARGGTRQDSRLCVVLAPAFLCFPSSFFPPAPRCLRPQDLQGQKSTPAHAPKPAGTPFFLFTRSASATMLYTNIPCARIEAQRAFSCSRSHITSEAAQS